MASRVRGLRWLAVVTLGVLWSFSVASAQVTTGEVTGRIADTQGKIVPGVNVTATNAGTGLVRSVTTNDAGEYTLAQLPPGTYTLSAELTGFRKSVAESLQVNVGSRLTLNFDLEIGNLTEVVQVSAASAQIETTKSDISGVVTPEDIQNLPIINRTFANLSTTMPEARPAGNFDPTKTRTGNVAMSGGDGRQLDVNVDGGDNKDNVVGSLLQNFAYESIQEFQVLQHRWTAESGRAVGGVVNVVTKSGTNDMHGSFFTNFRNRKTRAMDFFEKQLDAANPAFEKAEFDRRELGGSVGGPIRRNRLFFFGALEHFREDQNNLVTANALTQLGRIPGINAINAIPTPYRDTLATVKVDHQLTPTQLMFYRFSSQVNESPNDQVAVPATTDLNGGNTNDNKIYSFVGHHTWTMSANKLNQFSFHYQNFKNEILGVTDQPNLVFPSVQTGANVNTPQQTTERKFQFRNDFTWQRDAHSLKLGVNYIHTELGGFFFFGSKGYQLTFFDDPVTIATNTALYPQGFATPGAIRQLTFSDGEASHDQTFHQVALYLQDDWRLNSKLTMNVGLRWDVNANLLTDQTNNRTVRLLQQLNDPRAQEIVGDPDRLSRSTPSWKEFQPRIGFAWDPRGEGKMVIRGGYGVFYDQIFQNLTLFSFAQSTEQIYTTIMNLTNSAVGQGQLANYRFGVDPLPAPPAPDFTNIAVGGFGRVNDPGFQDPYVQKASIGFQQALNDRWTVSADVVHTLGIHEPRVQVINPRIQSVCDPAFPGSTPADPRCVRGANTRYFDRAFVDAGLGAGRLEQINLIGGSNRSQFSSLTGTVKGRLGKGQVSVSYVLGNSRSWGGQPVASYTGNGIATTPENQFKEEEFGPTRMDERHRVVASGYYDFPWGLQLASILQFASARPYSLNAGVDIDGDGLTQNDRICDGVDPRAVFDVRGNSAAILALNTRGCRQVQVNSQRSGFIVDPDGSIRDVSGRFFNVDLRVTKAITFAARYSVKVYADLYNVFNTENLAIGNRFGTSAATSAGTFMQPSSLFGPGFGPPVGRPFTAVFGARFEF